MVGKYFVSQNYYRILQKLSSPLTHEGLDILCKNKANRKSNRPYIYVTNYFIQYLTPDIKTIFQTLNILPDALVVFGHQNDINFKLNAVVHSDIRLIKNNWVDSPCAINWEITDSEANFSWWDVYGAKKCYPSPYDEYNLISPPSSPDYLERLLGSGIHYTSWNNKDYKSYRILETCVLNKQYPILIRTDIPHSVEYSGFKDRISISLRFSPDKISDWKSALKIFNNLI